MIKIIPLLFLITSCGLYVDNSYDYTYGELLNYGLEEIDYSNPSPVIVIGDGGRVQCYEVESWTPADKWSLKEVLSNRDVVISSYISNEGSSIVLSPTY